MGLKLRPHPGLLVIVLAATACVSARLPPAGGDARERLEVEKVVAGIIEADNSRDIDGVLALYEDDAMLLPPNETAILGKAAIRPRYESLFSAWMPEIIPSIDELQISGEWAWVIGRNRGRLVSRDGEAPRELDDAYLMLLSKREGSWKIARLIWHSARAK